MFTLANGQNEEVVPGEEAEIEAEAEVETSKPKVLAPSATNLDVFLIDRIHGSQIRLSNCMLRLVGEMKVAEDSFTYENTFVDGGLYKITVMIELKETK